MRPTSLILFCTMTVLLCCHEDSQFVLVEDLEETEKQEEDDGSTGAGTKDESVSKEEFEEPKFDPCPEDTYFLWEKDGIRYEITIPVFCEPIQDLNLGCPAP